MGLALPYPERGFPRADHLADPDRTAPVIAAAGRD